MKTINRNALRNYHILETIEAGIKLTGAEVKSIRAGRLNLSESFARVSNKEVYLFNAHIPPFHSAQIKNYDSNRARKLLLHKDQINSLVGKISGKKTALVPVAVYEKHNLFKVELGLAKSKREFDKRQAIKERDHLRRIEQELKGKE